MAARRILGTEATGMVGGLALRDCLRRSEVAGVVAVGRRPTGVQAPRLTELLHAASPATTVCFPCTSPRDPIRPPGDSLSSAHQTMSEPVYERWLADYRRRREAVRTELASIGAETLEIDSDAGLEGNWCTAAGRRHLRERRASLRHPFCLLLWSGGFDERLFREQAEDEESAPDPDHARGLLQHKAGNFRPRIARLTVRLDLADRYAVMLWPESRNEPPPEPLILTPPGGPGHWYYVFTVAVELAEAVVIEANYGRGLSAELSRIHEVGLAGRVLLFDNDDELYRFEDDRRWPLESIGDAVTFAAAQPVSEAEG